MAISVQSGAIACTRSGTNWNDRQVNFYSYASHPAIDTAETFNVLCDNDHQQQFSDAMMDSRIYIYDIADKRLTGIRATYSCS